MELVGPSLAHLPSYVAALERGWSPITTRPEAGHEELALIESDTTAFLAGLDDPHALGPGITLGDGVVVKRLPSFRRWMWDGEFSGSIGLRWSPGTPVLPPTCLGHIGYAVVPWKRGLGYATAALAQILPEARKLDLPYVELVTDVDNLASQRVILANGGTLVEPFQKARAQGGGDALRFRIEL